MVKDLIKVLDKGNTRQQEFDALSPEEKKKELSSYKPYFKREIPANITTDINSSGILDVILGSEEVGFNYNNGSENLLRFLYHALMPKEKDIDSIGMTSSIKMNFFIPLVKADFVVHEALKEINRLQPKKLVTSFVLNTRGNYVYDKDGNRKTETYRLGWDVSDQKMILKNTMRSVTTLLLIRYIRKFGIDDNLIELGVSKSTVSSRNKYCSKYYDLKESVDSKNVISETDNSFIENEQQIIEKLKEIDCDKWPGDKGDIKGLYSQSKLILKILKIKLSKLEDGKMQPFKISDLEKITGDDTIVVVSSYGVLTKYLNKLINSNITNETNLKGCIIYKLKDMVNCIIRHCSDMYTLKHNRVDLSKESYKLLMGRLHEDYKKLDVSWLRSIKPKHIIPDEEVIDETYQSYLRFKGICDWLNGVFNYECIKDTNPFTKDCVS